MPLVPNNAIYFALLENYDPQKQQLTLSAYQYPNLMRKAWEESFSKTPENTLKMNNLFLMNEKQIPDYLYAFTLIDCQSNIYTFIYDASLERINQKADQTIADLDQHSDVANSFINKQDLITYWACDDRDCDLWKAAVIKIKINKA